MAESESQAGRDDERTTIRSGREFEEEYRLDASEAGAFLVNLGEQLRDGEELEIELELPGRTDEAAPDVE